MGYCELWACPSSPFCRSHHVRGNKHGRPDVDQFVISCQDAWRRSSWKANVSSIRPSTCLSPANAPASIPSRAHARPVSPKWSWGVLTSRLSRLLCHAVVKKEEINREFGIDFDTYFAPELQELQGFEEDALVKRLPGEIQITGRGRIFMRNVAMVFDSYLKQQEGDKPRFSRTL